MIANLSVGMSMKLVSMHVLVVTVKTAAAMEIGVGGNQTQSWSPEKAIQNLSHFLTWWIHPDPKITTARTKCTRVQNNGISKTIGFLVHSSLAIECSLLVVKVLMVTITMSSSWPHHNGLERRVRKSMLSLSVYLLASESVVLTCTEIIWDSRDRHLNLLIVESWKNWPTYR